MRHDGVWPRKDLEPGTDTNQIANLRDTLGNVIAYSDIRYTCDEFPLASWIQGGSGIGVPGNTANPGNAETRCAALTCKKASKNAGMKNKGVVKAEQNWQGMIHTRLSEELKRHIDRRIDAFDAYDYYVKRNSTVPFFFRMANYPNDGVTARVYSYADPAGSQLQDPSLVVTQAKRSQLD